MLLSISPEGLGSSPPLLSIVERNNEWCLEIVVRHASAQQQGVVEDGRHCHEVASVAYRFPLVGCFVEVEYEVNTEGIKLSFERNQLINVFGVFRGRAVIVFHCVFQGSQVCIFPRFSEVFRVYDTASAEVGKIEFVVVVGSGIGYGVRHIVFADNVFYRIGIAVFRPRVAFVGRAGDIRAVANSEEVVVYFYELVVVIVCCVCLYPAFSLVFGNINTSVFLYAKVRQQQVSALGNESSVSRI